MASVFVIKTEIYGVTSENATEKLKPHFDEVIRDISLFNIPHIRAITRIEKLSENKVLMMTDILDRK
jgi:selenocysteine-specific translation elongation factor